jgi:hypothetical protein
MTDLKKIGPVALTATHSHEAVALTPPQANRADRVDALGIARRRLRSDEKSWSEDVMERQPGYASSQPGYASSQPSGATCTSGKTISLSFTLSAFMIVRQT